MLPEQRLLVQRSWPRDPLAADELARCFYARLFAIDSDAARLFAATDMAAQRAKLVTMLAVIVRLVDEPRELVPGLAALGRRHATYGVADQHYASVGEALLAALGATLGAAFTPDVRVAWSEAYALVGAVMRRAASHPPHESGAPNGHPPLTRAAAHD
jgi:hemoglobin-like flavoprotein